MFTSDRYKFATLVVVTGTAVSLYTKDGTLFFWVLVGVFAGLLVSRRSVD